MIVPGGGKPYVHHDRFDHTVPLVFTVADALDGAACGEMIDRIERLGPVAAPISTAAGFVMRPDIRNNTRVMFDDVPLAVALFTRLAGALPPRMCGRRVVGINERFRCYRYQPGQRFAPHSDGAFRRHHGEASELTLMIYLNEAFTGGETNFLETDATVAPRTGMALLFQHQLLHEGATVTTGAKYVLRSDVMYAD
ncbi:MAG: 2OG-Fe(II) oxygenase [Kofleriaceae bacterium]